ncbi:MAG: epoxyqueuosine reductase QueH [Solobacterium sp.]|nr:epoxyqueuosine reductase QueH [Solobacterium sp.]
MNKEEFFAYLQERKKMPKTNYHLLALEEIKKIDQLETKPSILLHACCIVCACWPIEFLKQHFNITLLYNNSNIYPKEEWDLRLLEMKRYVQKRYGDEIQVVVKEYDNQQFTKKLESRKDDPEGYKRCFICYEDRMKEAFTYANEHHFDYFTTVMTFSRQKDSQKLNEIGRSLAKEFEYTKYFYSDFKKDNGQLHSNEICSTYNLYKQNYCGCIYSYLDAQNKADEAL